MSSIKLNLTRNTKVGLGLLAVGLIICFYFVGTAEVVQACEDKTDTAHEAQAANESVSRSFVFISRHCWGEFLSEDDKPLVALGTLGLLVVTGLLAFYTLRLWGATAKLVDDAHEMSERELRAYLGMRSGEFTDQTWTDKHRVSYKFVPLVVNSGQTPAYNVVCAVRAALLLFAGPDFDYSLPPKNEKRLGVIGPGESVPIHVWADEAYPPEMIARIASSTPTDQQLWLYLYGTLRYKDAFDAPHFTEFCYWMNLGGEYLPTIWNVNPWHNNAD